MTALTAVPATRQAGADLTTPGLVAATNGDTFPASPNVFLRVKNAGGSPCTVTVVMPSGSGLSNYALNPAVPITTGDRMFGPFPAYPFGDSNGLVTVNYSSTASVTVQAILATD